MSVSIDAFTVLPNVVKGPSAATWQYILVASCSNWRKQEIFLHTIWEFNVLFVCFFVGPVFHLFEWIDISYKKTGVRCEWTSLELFESISRMSAHTSGTNISSVASIAQMIWLFNVQLSECSAYWASASSPAYPECARKSGYTEPEPSRGLSQQSKTQRWCRHQQLKSQTFVRLKSLKSQSLLVWYDPIGLHWRRKYHEISLVFDDFAQIEAKVCEECQVFSVLSHTFPVTDIRCCFCILCSVRQPSLPNMRLKCKKFSMLNCTPWGKK